MSKAIMAKCPGILQKKLLFRLLTVLCKYDTIFVFRAGMVE